MANPAINEPVDEELKTLAMETIAKVDAKMNDLHIADALEEIFVLLNRCNKYIDETTPWALAKDPDQISRLATVLYNLLETIRIAAVLLAPFIPVTSDKILNQLGTEKRDYDSLAEFGQYETGISVTKTPEILFKRLDEKEVSEKIAVIQEKIAAQRKVQEERQAQISVEDFAKIVLKVGRVIACEKHPNADSLLVMKVDVGEGKPRQIVSGIAGSYTPGQMIGKHIVVITNLKPAVIRGLESQGMLLAGKENNVLAVAEVNGLKPGTRIN